MKSRFLLIALWATAFTDLYKEYQLVTIFQVIPGIHVVPQHKLIVENEAAARHG